MTGSRSGKRLTRLSLVRLAHYGSVVTVALLALAPLVIVVLNGFKSNAEISAQPLALPERWRWENHAAILATASFWRQLLNSTIVMLCTACAVTLLASLAAFAVSRMRLPGRETIFYGFTLGLLFPLTVAMLPLYLSLRSARLLDTLWGVIVPQIAFGLPGAVLLLRSSFDAMPKELDEAAAIDGCTPLRYLFGVLLPIMRPALAAVAVLSMVGSWNSFYLPLLVLTSEANYTLPLGLMQFQGQYGADLSGILAFVSLALIPTVGFYLLAERHVVAGLTAGATSG